MKIGCLSLFGSFSSVMARIADEIGQENTLTCYLYKDYRLWWDGIINKLDCKYERGVAINALQEFKKFNPDFVIFDMSQEGELADQFIKSGIKVIGASSFCDLLELDRYFSMKMIKTLGFNIPATVPVKNYKEAVTFLRERDKKERWVVKFNDNQGNFSSYVSTDILDMLEELEHFSQANRVDFSRGAILQEYIKGIELSCEGWFNGTSFIPELLNYTMEEKKFLTGSLGPSTGCEGNIVWKADKNDPIPKQLNAFSYLLSKYNYIGPLDVNNIIATEEHQYEGFQKIKEGTAYVVEPTPRFGYDAIYALLEGIDGKISDFFYNIGKRNELGNLLSSSPLTAVRVSIPPYPYNDIAQPEDKEIAKLARKAVKYMEKTTEWTIVRLKEPKLLNHIWLQDVRYDDKNNRLIVNGTDSVIAVCTAKADTLQESIERTLEIVKSIDVPDAQYRLDIGRRSFEEIPILSQYQILHLPTWLSEKIDESEPEKT